MGLQGILVDEALNHFPKILEVIKDNENKDSMIAITLRKMANSKIAIVDMCNNKKEDFTAEVLSHFKHLNYI